MGAVANSMNGAFYSNSIKDLLDQSPEAILGHFAKQNPFALDPLQRNAWLTQISLLQSQFGDLDGWIAFRRKGRHHARPGSGQLLTRIGVRRGSCANRFGSAEDTRRLPIQFTRTLTSPRARPERAGRVPEHRRCGRLCGRLEAALQIR